MTEPAGRPRPQAFDVGDYHVAPLTVDDCDALGRIHNEVWRRTYAGLMRPEYLAALDDVEAAVRWRSRAESGPGEGVVLVAHDSRGEVVGFVTAGPSRGDDPPAAWELYAVNLLPSAHGTGLADALLDHALGDRDTMLWVAQGNDRALAFYRRRGFVADGTVQEYKDSGATELRMLRRRSSG